MTGFLAYIQAWFAAPEHLALFICYWVIVTATGWAVWSGGIPRLVDYRGGITAGTAIASVAFILILLMGYVVEQ